MKPISVVIPVRKGGNPEVTLRSLAAQTLQDFDVIVAWDEVGNANWARNKGAALARTPLILFSDDDIRWEPDAVELLAATLKLSPGAAYAYGAYEMGGRIQCNVAFSAERLRRTNFISTMSLVRRDTFPGFDESLRRLQDWDLFLSMLSEGYVGVYCGAIVFRTDVRDGITQGGPISYEAAKKAVVEKHGL